MNIFTMMTALTISIGAFLRYRKFQGKCNKKLFLPLIHVQFWKPEHFLVPLIGFLLCLVYFSIL